MEINTKDRRLKAGYPPLHAFPISIDWVHMDDWCRPLRITEEDEKSGKADFYRDTLNVYNASVGDVFSRQMWLQRLLMTCYERFCPHHIPTLSDEECVIRYDFNTERFSYVFIKDSYAPGDIPFPNSYIATQVVSYLEYLQANGIIYLSGREMYVGKEE